MTLERLLSIVAFVFLCGFLLILIMYVPRVDLGAVILVCVALCLYDLFFHRPASRRR